MKTIKYLIFIYCAMLFLIPYVSAQKTQKPVVFYLQNLPHERIGTETDETIIDSMRSQNFWVIPVDCSRFPRASPKLEERLVTFHMASPELLDTYATSTEEADLDNIYYVPEGHILKYKIPIWNIIDHGADGSLERIMDIWNNEVVEKFGLDPVTSPEEMYDKHGNPIDYNMYMDLIYPSGTTTKKVPIVVNFASNSPRHKPFNPTNMKEVVYRNIFPFGFLTSGYAWATVDHCYVPLSRHDVWTHFNRGSMDDWNGLSLARAYIRYINTHLDQYNLNGKIGTMGISKASYSSTRIANTRNAEGKERYFFNGVENNKPQPWPGVPSTVDVAYSAAGNGTRLVNKYVDKFTVPMVTSAGRKDQYNQWDVYPVVVKRFIDLDKNHLAFWMENLGHTYPGLGIDLATGENRYKLLKEYFDGFLKVSVFDPLKVFYVYPKENATEINTDGFTRIMAHDGTLPPEMLGLKPYAPITVRFLTKIDSVGFVENIKIYHKESNMEILGRWIPKIGRTTYEFFPENNLINEQTYKIVVSRNLQNVNGQQLESDFVREFTVSEKDEEIIDDERVMIASTDDTYQKVSLSKTSYGLKNIMRIRYSQNDSWRFDGYIKFDISGLEVNNVKTAKVRFSSAATVVEEPVSIKIFKTKPNWSESTLLSTNKPSIISAELDVVDFTGADLWTFFDVTNQLKTDVKNGQKEISFILRVASGGTTENVYFNTKEVDNETLRPALVIEEYGPAAGL